MSDTENISVPQGRKRKRKRNFGFVYLFLFVFLIALAIISYFVKMYSPDIDVAIGNNESLTLNDVETEIEVKSVDERLKWIQMEDELPTVALRNPEDRNDTVKELLGKDSADVEKTKKENSDDKKSEEKKDKSVQENKSEKQPPIPTISDIKKQHSDFREIPAASPVVPSPSPSVTKVYLGKYSTIEEAMKVQNDVSAAEPSVTPFVKAVNDSYIVQLGSFSDKERATALIVKLRAKGYSPKISYQN